MEEYDENECCVIKSEASRVRTVYRDFEVLHSSLVCSATNLLELNDLAERLSRLNEVQRIAFEGLVRVDFQKQESITLKRLRDLTESVDCCHVVESVVSDGQLGRFYAENGFVPEVEGMSDAAFELLDFEKVGKMARMGECGVYVPSGISGLGGYVVQHSDLKSAPEITLNQPVEPAYTIHLRLTAHHDNLPFAGTDVVDLKLPAEDNALEMAVRCLGYMDIYKANPNDLAAKAKAEKYSKILAKTLINTSGGDSAQYGQNAFFYDSAEGLLTAMFLLVAEYLPTEDENGNPVEKRHIVSVFKLVQELLAPSKVKGKNQFQILLEKLPPNHKARWFAGSALNTAEQAMASVISTVLSRLNAFLDSEMEQILCFDTAIDAEKFCNEKSAIFIVLPEEDQTKYFMVSLILQNLYREILTVADENGGRLKNRVVFFADELGTCPPIQSLELMFSASRSRGLMLVPIVQSITGQLKKNYGAEGAEVIVDNCQVNLYGGFAPASQTAVELSKALGSRTVMSGSISRGKNDPSQSLQMIERPLMTPDELKSMPKGSFIVAKTGVHPMKVKLRLFLDWGIRFGEPYEVPEKAQRAVAYADKQELEESIIRRHYGTVAEEEPPQDVPAAVGGMNHGMQAEKNSRKTILRP